MLFAAALFAAVLSAPPSPRPAPVRLPAGTHLRFHLVRPLSSDKSTTGQSFSFVLLGAIRAGNRVLVNDGAVGKGTVVLAGHAGPSGHEGDLTLRLDQIPAADGSLVLFCGQEIRINGRNRKILSGVLGLVPFAGIGARFIRGSEIRISTKTPVKTVLLEPTAGPAHDCPAVLSPP